MIDMKCFFLTIWRCLNGERIAHSQKSNIPPHPKHVCTLPGKTEIREHNHETKFELTVAYIRGPVAPQTFS